MNIKVRYSVLFYDGKKGSKTQNLECPYFEEFVQPCTIFGLGDLTITVMEQVDDWVSQQDKKEFMDSNDIQIIFDWEITSIIATESEASSSKAMTATGSKNRELVVKHKKLSKSQIIQHFASMLENEKMKADFLGVYIKMKSSISSLSYEKQIEVVLSGMGVAYASAINVYDRLAQFDKELAESKKTEKLLNSKELK